MLLHKLLKLHAQIITDFIDIFQNMFLFKQVEFVIKK
jgi:hypothetical protein